MEKVFADKWVKALRSGDYNQTQTRLKQIRPDDSVGMCCLGVLCDITKDKTGGEWVDGDEVFKVNNTFAELVIPEEVGALVGMSSSNGLLCFNDENSGEYDYCVDAPDAEEKWNTTALADLNDQGYTFAEIADVIEEYWEIL